MCTGVDSEMQDCTIMDNCPINCVWGGWGDWSECTATCGGGEKHKHRDILVAAQNGGSCDGAHNLYSSCSLYACSVEPTAYTAAPISKGNYEFRRFDEYYYFAVMGDAPVDGSDMGCQEMFMPVPKSWEIAPRDDASVMIAMQHSFETACVVLANGDCIRTTNSDPTGDDVRNADGTRMNALEQSGQFYRPKDCVGRVLIRKRNPFAPKRGEGLGRYHVKRYRGKCYATIDDIAESDQAIGKQFGYLAPPPRWQLAERDNSALVVISRGYWGAHTLVLANGDAVRTKGFGEAGKLWNKNEVLTLTETRGGATIQRYKPKNGYSRILIEKKDDDYTPTPCGLENYVEVKPHMYYATIDDSAREGQERERQYGYLALPKNWEVAEYTEDALVAAEKGRWSTCKVVLKDGTALWTKNEGNPGHEAQSNCLDSNAGKTEFKPKSHCHCMRVLITQDKDRRRRAISKENMINYRGAQWATLDNRHPKTLEVQQKCQQKFLQLPKDDSEPPIQWEIASQDDDLIHVIAGYYWASNRLIASDKWSRWTKRYANKGKLATSNDFEVKNHRFYRPTGCEGNTILIRLIRDQVEYDRLHQPPAKYQPYPNGAYYAVMDGTSKDHHHAGCQNQYRFMPQQSEPGQPWEVAPDNQESRTVAESFRWGTDGVILNNNVAIYTKSGKKTWLHLEV